MAHASWLNIAIAHGRSGPIYRVWDAVANLLAGGMAGKWTIVDASDDPVTWAGDLDPGDGDWVVIQSEEPWAGGEKLQVFLGLRATTGNLAGFGSKSAGLYCAYSPIGGWDLVNKWFGAALADWRNTSIRSAAGYTAACTMGLILTSGDTGLPGSFVLLTRSGTGENAYSFAVLALEPPSGLARASSRTAMLFGTANRATSSGYWGNTSNAGLCPDTGLSLIGIAYLWYSDFGRDRETSKYTEGLCAITDASAGRSLGIATEVLKTSSAANGDTDDGGTRWAWGLLTYPREAARDGVWV